MTSAKYANLASLMTSYNFEIEDLPDNLKCAKCKLVLKDPCQVPCGCTFCRICIDNMVTRGQFCPGLTEECSETCLSTVTPDYRANKNISMFIAKCPHEGCLHRCQLANMEEHLRECPRKSRECPFHELGCTRDKMAAEDIEGHLQHDNRRHSEILIAMIADMKRQIDDNRTEIGMLKLKLEMKDEQIRTLMDQVDRENKSIKPGTEDLAFQLKMIMEKIDGEIAERRENDELDSARLIEHVDREIAAISGLIESNKDQLTTEMNLIKSNFKSITDDICSVKSKMHPIPSLRGLTQLDTSHEWIIDKGVCQTCLIMRKSDHFIGAVNRYKYRLASVNDGWRADDSLWVWLVIDCGSPNDGQLPWPFAGRVVVTVTDRFRHKSCRRISLQCRIERPPRGGDTCSDSFVFPYSALIDAGIDLGRGLRILCEIFLA